MRKKKLNWAWCFGNFSRLVWYYCIQKQINFIFVCHSWICVIYWSCREPDNETTSRTVYIHVVWSKYFYSFRPRIEISHHFDLTVRTASRSTTSREYCLWNIFTLQMFEWKTDASIKKNLIIIISTTNNRVLICGIVIKIHKESKHAYSTVWRNDRGHRLHFSAQNIQPESICHLSKHDVRPVQSNEYIFNCFFSIYFYKSCKNEEKFIKYRIVFFLHLTNFKTIVENKDRIDCWF